MSKGFLLLDSYIEAIDQLPDDRRWPFCKELIAYRMEGKEPELTTPLEKMAWTVMKPTIDASSNRYKQAEDTGKKGGRPRKWIDREEAEKLYEQLGNWKDVAEKLDVNEDTLRRARTAWQQKPEQPKNHNVNVNDNENVNVNDNSHYQLINKKEASTPGPQGPASPQLKEQQQAQPMGEGYQFQKNGKTYVVRGGECVEIANSS